MWGAFYNVKINLPDITDEAYKKQVCKSSVILSRQRLISPCNINESQGQTRKKNTQQNQDLPCESSCR